MGCFVLITGEKQSTTHLQRLDLNSIYLASTHKHEEQI